MATKKHVSEQYHSNMSMLTMVAVVAIVGIIVMGVVTTSMFTDITASPSTSPSYLVGDAFKRVDASTGSTEQQKPVKIAPGTTLPPRQDAVVVCRDVDGGNAPLVSGRTGIYNIYSTGPSKLVREVKDSCNSVTVLTECYCENNELQCKNIDCTTFGYNYRCGRDALGIGKCMQGKTKPFTTIMDATG